MNDPARGQRTGLPCGGDRRRPAPRGDPAPLRATLRSPTAERAGAARRGGQRALGEIDRWRHAPQPRTSASRFRLRGQAGARPADRAADGGQRSDSPHGARTRRPRGRGGDAAVDRAGAPPLRRAGPTADSAAQARRAGPAADSAAKPSAPHPPSAPACGRVLGAVTFTMCPADLDRSRTRCTLGHRLVGLLGVRTLASERRQTAVTGGS
jgi:hypothetical protein